MNVDVYTFLLAAVVLAITPGPSILYVVAFSLRFGPAAGLISALGVNAGSYVLILVAAFGLYPFLQFAPEIITVVQTLGGLYMLYLAYQTWPHKPAKAKDLPSKPANSKREMFTRGFITTLLNPKDILFYILFIPSFIDAGEGHSGFLYWFLILSVVYALIGFATKAAIAVFAGKMKGFLASGEASKVNYLSSVILGGLGVFIFLKAIL